MDTSKILSQVLTTAEVADMLGIGKEQVNQWCREERLPCRLTSAGYLVHIDDAEAMRNRPGRGRPAGVG